MAESNKFVTRVELREIAEEAAEKVLTGFLGYLDVDPHRPETVQRLRKNLEFLDSQRAGAEELRAQINKGKYYLAGIAILGTLVWFKDTLIALFAGR